jgi:hypothetical protein
MSWINFSKIAVFVSVALLMVAGCSEDDNGNGPMEVTSRNFTVTLANISIVKAFSSSGVFNTPVGASQPGAIGPGGAYEFSFSAAPGSKLSFATMFVPSNDFFYAPDEDGIDLFDGSGNQNSGDITGMIQLWDAGTEINQEPGLGPDQAQRQSGPNTGVADPINQVRLAPDDFSNLPPVANVIQVTLTAMAPTEFSVRIENISTNNTLQTSDGGTQAVPMAPGVWVVHSDTGPLFMNNQMDYGNGLEALAEDGDPGTLATALDGESGLTNILAPGVWVVHNSTDPLFTANQADRDEGLEALAEDGDPATLASNVVNGTGVISSGIFNTPDGASQPGPILSGSSYSFSFSASPGQYLSFASMFVQSNDLFYSPAGMGIMLFEADGQPVTGAVTSQIMLWDAGTEVNEEPGIGLHQAPRQSGPNDGTDENGNVRLVNDGYSYPTTSEVIEVSISVQ